MKNIEVIAFYLPQYHPIKENDEWYGKGFTEWTNVGKAKPLFRGHYQPKVPADLGYYDLRVPEVQIQQAELAAKAGISAFCYYHYWFGEGRTLLERPLKQMLYIPEINMPFCICWANHTWYKKTWDSVSSELNKRPLLSINYGDEHDWTQHFYSLLPAFQDKRYYKIDGRLVFVLYRIADIPKVDEMKNLWNQLAVDNHLPEFYFMTYSDDPAKVDLPIQNSCERQILLLKSNIGSVGKTVRFRKLSRYVKSLVSQCLHIPSGVYQYSKIRKKLTDKIFANEDIVPVLLPNWDDTPRRAQGAMVFHNATPDQFYLHCKEVFDYVKEKDNKLVFLKSWNEWGEGNYIEPCLRYGQGYINALNKALNEYEKR